MIRKKLSILTISPFRGARIPTVIFVLAIACLSGYAQPADTLSTALSDTIPVKSDSNATKVLTVKDFYQQIVQNHPVAKQAALLPEDARQELRIARGAFDPKVEGSWDRKEFSEKMYYNKWENLLKVPLWIGELKGGYEYNRGPFLNSENNTSGVGLAYAGVSVPLGQGLLIDARRATLRQAQFFQEMAEADRVKEINKLLLNAAKDYWEWYLAYNEFILFEEVYNLNLIRFNAIKERVLYGESAPIDSIEAKTLLQERSIQFQQAQIRLTNTRLILSNYLWGEENVPLEVPDYVIPSDFNLSNTFLTEAILQELTLHSQVYHPDLVKLNFKVKQLEVEERFQRDRLKPFIQINYNFLSKTPFAPNEINTAMLTNNYKLGAQLSFPLFLRKERGKVQQTRIKITQTSLERIQTNREINNGIQASYNELRNLQQLISLQDDMVSNYLRLRNGEIQKFEAGESSIFLINSRETKLIEAQIKLLSFKSKYEKEKANLRWTAGKPLWED